MAYFSPSGHRQHIIFITVHTPYKQEKNKHK